MDLTKLSKKEFGEALVPEQIYKLKYKAELEKLYEKLYFDNIHYSVISNIFALSQLFALVTYIFLFPIIHVTFYDYLTSGIIWKFIVIFSTWSILSLSFYYIFLLGYFFYHDTKFQKIEKEIEECLPEFIDNLVSNLKGGISLEKALLKSVRKEQTALLKEVTLINEKIMMGQSVEQALREFKDRFESPILNRTLFLIEEGIKGGGNLAEPLAKISQNLKKIYELNEEIKANSGGFAIVIQSITLIVTPLLFALALTLLTFIGNLFTIITKSSDEFSFLQPIPAEFTAYLQVFSYAMIVLITFFSSLIIAQLKNEKVYESLKYVPISIAVSIFLYIQFSKLLLSFFGNIF